MGRYDAQQICLNGHQTTSTYHGSPARREALCKTCGEKTINECPNCNVEIRGYYKADGIPVFDVGTPTPEHCYNCGAPYPWTERKKEPAKAHTEPSPAVASHTPTRNQVFISYSHADKEWLHKLQIILKPIERGGGITTWDDTVIRPGQRWKKEIERALSSAKVAVLLVSDAFLASDFVAKHELPSLLEKEDVTILWVCLSPCLYDLTEIGDYQAAHDPTQPLERLPPSEQKEVLVSICRKIMEAARSKAPAELSAEEARRRERERQEREEKEKTEQRSRAQATAVEAARLREQIRSAKLNEDWGAVIRAAESLLRITPSDQSVKDILTQAIHQQDLLATYTKGIRHYRKGELYSALIEFRTLRVKENDYKDVEVLITEIESTIKEREARLKAAAQVAVASCAWEDAIDSYEALLKITAPNEDITRGLTEARANQEKLERAYSDGLANRQTDLDLALKHLLQARRMGGSYKDVDALIADVQLKIERREEERRRSERALKEKAEELRSKAQAALDNKDFWQARDFLLSLQQIEPTNAFSIKGLEYVRLQLKLRALYAKGLRRYKAGRLHRASKYFREIQKLKSDYKNVGVLLKAIDRKELLFPYKYYLSITCFIVGLLIDLYNVLYWLTGDTAVRGCDRPRLMTTERLTET
jgi:hypothetical protein